MDEPPTILNSDGRVEDVLRILVDGSVQMILSADQLVEDAGDERPGSYLSPYRIMASGLSLLYAGGTMGILLPYLVTIVQGLRFRCTRIMGVECEDDRRRRC